MSIADKKKPDEKQSQTDPTVERPGVDSQSDGSRLSVLKTYKLYINGQFPRTESGRYDKLCGPDGKPLANLCRASRKDFRNAVVPARGAHGGWAARSAYNRSQILYRIAEMLEGRREQFVAELKALGRPEAEARSEVAQSVDRWVYFAGWCDKVQQVFSSVNPVSSSHFNFSMLEATGVVAIVAPQHFGLLGLTSVIAPVIASGNTCVVLASEQQPLPAITLGEVLQTSDVPAGVVNLLTGHRDELLEHMALHMDVNALLLCSDDSKQIAEAQTRAAENLKRVKIERRQDWRSDEVENPYSILDFVEVKTTWHPIGS
jgi:acyl-CoA reductase-like NAD-dependent aldehyde dehydrogenase